MPKVVSRLRSFLLFVFFTCFVIQRVHAASLQTNMGVGDTMATFTGFTSPGAQVTILKDNVVVGNVVADGTGQFSKTLVSQDPGIFNFAFVATDTQGHTTATSSFSLALLAYLNTTLSNIVLSPTFNVNTTTWIIGDLLSFSGMATPGSSISIYFSPSETTEVASASATGEWSKSISTQYFHPATHQAYFLTDIGGGNQSVVATTTLQYLSPTPSTSNSSSDGSGSPAPTSQSSSSENTSQSSSTATQSAVDIKQLLFKEPSKTALETAECSIPPSVLAFNDAPGCFLPKADVKQIMTNWTEEFKKYQDDPSQKACDVDADGKCGAKDFSLMLFYLDRNGLDEIHTAADGKTYLIFDH